MDQELTEFSHGVERTNKMEKMNSIDIKVTLILKTNSMDKVFEDCFRKVKRTSWNLRRTLYQWR